MGAAHIGLSARLSSAGDPDGAEHEHEPAMRAKRGAFISINRSPLARRIITFNLIAILVLVAGVLYVNPFRDSLVLQRERGLVAEAELVSAVIEARFAARPTAAGIHSARATLAALDLRNGVEVFLFSPGGRVIATTYGMPRATPPPVGGLTGDNRSTLITGALNAAWGRLSAISKSSAQGSRSFSGEVQARALVPAALDGNTQVRTGIDPDGKTIFSIATPTSIGGGADAVVALISRAGEIDELVRAEREQVLQMFVIAILVSIGLSLALASTIANPLSDLARAAEIGRDRNARRISPSRVRIPDMSSRPDEIGRLSGALGGMVAALYDRIDANEQFAADVAHEIKNPLASLRSAIGTLRVVQKGDQRGRLLDVIEHDVRRLDRLVSDISNASRLDSELVKGEEAPFDLIGLIEKLAEHFGAEATEAGIRFVTDLPTGPLMIDGLESRLAQVFVNLISNAISFCEKGDAIRVWVRRRDDRVLAVVEDTGPGIPEAALTKVFDRFYSERPASHFGNNSGLGLAISKQIVEAHGGVVWVENIRPTEADIASEPLGARFVVGLPV